MAFAAPLLPWIGIGLTVAGHVARGNQEAKAQAYQAEVARRNKAVAEQNAERAIERGQLQAMDQDIITKALVGQQESLQSASGLSTAGRSFTMTRDHANRLGRLDSNNIRESAEVDALDYRNAAETYATEALYRSKSAGASRLVGWLNAGSSLVGFGADHYSREAY